MRYLFCHDNVFDNDLYAGAKDMEGKGTHVNVLGYLDKQLQRKNQEKDEFIKYKEIQFKDSDDYKGKKIEIRVSDEEKELLTYMAKLNRMNVSQLIRYVMFNIYLNSLIKVK